MSDQTSDGRASIVLRNVRFGYARRRMPWGASAGAAFACESLDIPTGLSLLLGANGSGKSTLLKLIAGVEAPETGTVLVNGRDLWRDEAAARRPIAYVPEQPDVTPYASVGEVLRLVATLRDAPASDSHAALERAGLADLAHRTVRELSMGQRRRALLGAAFIGQPSVLLLDEPLESMDRRMRDEIVAWLEQRLASGATAIVATHEIEPFVEMANRVIAVRAGTAHIVSELPSSSAQRMAVLDDFARGVWS